MNRESIISKKPALYKNGEIDLNAAKAYRKETNKIIRDIQIVQNTIDIVGWDKAEVIEQLKKKYTTEEVNRLTELYLQMMEVGDRKKQSY